MNRTADPSYLEAASTLAPQAVSEYLALSPWDLERRDEIKEIWRLAGPEGKAIGRLMLPLDADYSDFRDRFYDALVALGRINDWDADELQEQILGTRADLFFVRLDQPTADGTIPIRQAEVTIEAIYKMLRSAASTAANARSARGEQLLAAVNSFLEDDVRLGHTKRGSFIFTVAARLSDRLPANLSLTDADAESASPYVFSRHVMETLAHNLETARDLTRGTHVTYRFSDDTIISPGTLESLEDITKPEGLRSVELSFHWATVMPNPDVGVEPIRLEHRAASNLSRIRERFEEERPKAPVKITIRRERIVGPVLSLTRESANEESDETGEIVVLANVARGGRDKPRHIHVRLSGQDHERAIQAYRSKIPITVSGNLVFERQRWRLVGDVEVHASL